LPTTAEICGASASPGSALPVSSTTGMRGFSSRARQAT
jgi:hypothetical protein